MKILKPGKTLKKSQTIYFICYHCDCEYSCETTEPICRKCEYGIVSYKCFCPNCNRFNIGMDYQQYLKNKNG